MVPFFASHPNLITYAFKLQFPCATHLRKVITNAVVKTNTAEHSIIPKIQVHHIGLSDDHIWWCLARGH